MVAMHFFCLIIYGTFNLNLRIFKENSISHLLMTNYLAEESNTLAVLPLADVYC